jgi:hypothetical protein
MRLNEKWKKDVVVEPWREQLRIAAEILRNEGHVKFTIQTPEGFCALGAIAKATLGDPWSREAMMGEAVQRFGQSLPLSAAEKTWGVSLTTRICEWNNAAERTKDDVIAALEACAAA